jgi:hypothetical protein
MKQNNYIHLMGGLIFLGLLGCTATKNAVSPALSIKEVSSLAQEEKVELLFLLEQYATSLQGLIKKQDEENEKIRKMRTEPYIPPKQFLIKGKAFCLDESDHQTLLSGIKATQESCIAKNQTHTVYLTNIDKINPFLERDYRRVEFCYNPYLVAIGKKQATFSVVTNHYPHYFYYIGKDDVERKISLEGKMITGFSMAVTPDVQLDDKTIILDYVIKAIPIENLAFKAEGKASLLEGKALFIECLPTNPDLTESERRKRLLVFIACEIMKQDSNK